MIPKLIAGLLLALGIYLASSQSADTTVTGGGDPCPPKTICNK